MARGGKEGEKEGEQMNVISCDFSGTCPYREGIVCMLPRGWWCNQQKYQYERIPLDIVGDKNVPILHDMDLASNSAIRLRRV
jgi:hypothetical protein